MQHKIGSSLAAAAALCSLPAMAFAAQSQDDRLASCIKSVSALGAEISRSDVTAKDGRQAYQFVVRTNGVDYRVKCDKATGVVGDVTPAATTQK